ncbi:Abi family protein [Limosilactobacillus equigenerosi]|uniref:Abi family protein n=1 Tax=Limosilactobacillus equigenerosi TaxID=417373 RepID=UPI0021E88C7E|nr:Abi family protein [Limosilactobacillus equigenerosi]
MNEKACKSIDYTTFVCNNIVNQVKWLLCNRTLRDMFFYMSLLRLMEKIMNKPFLPVEKQIEQLKVERGLLFQNEESAKELLLRYGYYEIINGYKEHFMNSSKDDNEGFKEGTTFEHIYSLFTFDRNLRTQVMSSLETFELSLRQAVAYTVSENISYMQDEYMNRNNYTSGKKAIY